MKIVDKRNVKRVITFAEINQGECFIDEDGDVVMKTEVWEYNNAINLANGASYFYEAEAEVTPVKADLTIYD